MIFAPYGFYTVPVQNILLSNEPCTNCRDSNGLIVTKYVKVRHYFYIPIFFTSRTEIVCKSCKEIFELNGLSHERKKHFKNIIPFKILPIWLFSLPIILLICISIYFFNSNSDKKEMARRLSETPLNRILEYEVKENTFSAIKIVGFSNNDYFYFANSFETEKAEYVSNLTEDKYFIKDTLTKPKADFEKWIEEGKIISVSY